MTTYTAITNAQIDQDSPITQPLITALRDNPVALAEGAAGAPRVQKEALGGLCVGAVTGSSGGVSIIDLDGVLELTLIGDIKLESLSATVPIFQVQFSNNNGSTFGTAQTVFSGLGNNNVQGSFTLSANLDTGFIRAAWGGYGVGVVNLQNATFTVPTDCNAVRLVSNLAQSPFACGVYVTGGRS